MEAGRNVEAVLFREGRTDGSKKKAKRQAALNRELTLVQREELRLKRLAVKAAVPRWKTELESRVPEKLRGSLEAAFVRAFSLVFTHGLGVIERCYDRSGLEDDHAVLDYAVMVKGSRRELKKLRKNVDRASLGNMALTTVEGLGLGALGIGMPDILLFTALLLKGIYETALRYGFAYDTPEERLLILKMMETAMVRGYGYIQCDTETERLFSNAAPGEGALRTQLQKTANAFSMDMLLMKFVQGFPMVGILGGAANPVYYRRVMRYVELKYRKRYLLDAARRSRLAPL